MDNIQRERIKERLDALDLNAFEAARRADLSRSMIHDLLLGKKQSIRPKYMPRIATVLGCDPEYLMGYQHELVLDYNHIRFSAENRTIPVTLRCELGSWRDPSVASTMAKDLRIEADERYPMDAQVGFSLVGDDAKEFDVTNGSLLVVGKSEEIAECGRGIFNGDIVVVENERSGAFEYTVRKYIYKNGEILLRSGLYKDDVPDTVPSDNNKVFGLVLSAKKIF